MGKSLVSCFFETRCMFCVRQSVLYAPFFVKSVHEIVADKLTGIARSNPLPWNLIWIVVPEIR